MGSSPLEYARLRARSLAPLLPRFKWQVCSTSIVSPSRTEMMGPEKSLAKAGSSNYTHEDASWSAHTRSSTFVLWGGIRTDERSSLCVILHDDEETLP